MILFNTGMYSTNDIDLCSYLSWSKETYHTRHENAMFKKIYSEDAFEENLRGRFGILQRSYYLTQVLWILGNL